MAFDGMNCLKSGLEIKKIYISSVWKIQKFIKKTKKQKKTKNHNKQKQNNKAEQTFLKNGNKLI
jgi:hypothetical protein